MHGMNTTGFQMIGHALRQNRDVVPTLQNGNEPSPSVGLGDLLQVHGHRDEVLELQAKPADRIFGVGIEPRAQENQLRLQLIGHVFKRDRKAAMYSFRGVPKPNRQVPSGAQPAAAAGLPRRPVPG